MSSVANSLDTIFKSHRLIFWYDPEGEMRTEFDEYDSLNVEKVEIANNEFSLKHRLSREEQDRSFLLYAPYPRPKHSKNWLLDLELGNYLFHADGISLVLNELKWQEENRSFVEKYRTFFNSAERRKRLKERLLPDDGEADWPLKMLSVVLKEDANIDACIFALLEEHSEGGAKKWSELEKFELDSYFWDLLARSFKYETPSPSLSDFTIELLIATSPCGKDVSLGREAQVIVSRWQDSARYRGSFEVLSEKVSKDLNIANDLDAIEGYSQLLNQHAFEAIERKIITELRDGLADERISLEKLKSAISKRESTFWYQKYEHIYEAMLAAAELRTTLLKLDYEFASTKEAIDRYRSTYWKIDQLYRHFRYHAKQSGQATLLDTLSDEVERRYCNEFLLRLNDRFQQYVDAEAQWPPKDVNYQREFYKRRVVGRNTKRKDSKLFVIVSDALRYEIGEELHKKINREQRFRSKLDYSVSTLPSYTQLGMAALLPHKQLEVTSRNAEVLADGKRTTGVEARGKILSKDGRRAIAIKAKAFLEMNTNEEGRALARDHDLIYIYQNEIDSTGDKSETETNVFEAVNREFDTILSLIRKVAAVNGNNIVVTADHGFLFTNTALDDSDFTENPTAENVEFLNRRFAIGNGFKRTSNITCYKSAQLGLEGDLEIAIPKSINRFRVKGSGSKFVHGGSSLQEIVVPVLEINKARQDDIETVDVDIIRSGSNLITTNQSTITFYQEEPVVDKVLPRFLKIGFFSRTGDLLSNNPEIVFESSEEEPRLRERKVNFIFSAAADKKENQNTEILLRLIEKIPGSNRDRIYKEFPYRLNKAFETDFEL